MYNTCVSLVQTNIARERAVLHSKAMCCLSSLWVGAVSPSKMVTTCRCLGQNTLWIPGCCFGCGCDSRDMRFLRGLAMDACQCAFARRSFCPELRLRLTNITCAKSMRSGTKSTAAAATCCGEVWMVQHCACGTAPVREECTAKCLLDITSETILHVILSFSSRPANSKRIRTTC